MIAHRGRTASQMSQGIVSRAVSRYLHRMEPTAQEPPPPVELENLEVVGYSDLGGRPGLKLALQVVGQRWYLFTGQLWHRGWSVLDVTDPSAPQVVATIPGPRNTWTIQVNVADGMLLGGL